MFMYYLQVFNSRPNLTRHLTAVHGYRPPSPRKLKPRSPFYIKSTPLTRLARRLCQDLYNKVHHCRVPGGALNIQEIRSQCKSFTVLSFFKLIYNYLRPCTSNHGHLILRLMKSIRHTCRIQTVPNDWLRHWRKAPFRTVSLSFSTAFPLISEAVLILIIFARRPSFI